jgi:hypothetical protein
MKTRPFAVGDLVVSVRDVEASNRAIVICEVDARGLVLVRFADGMSRALPVQSIERVSDRKDESRSRPIGQGKDWAESKNLGDYLVRLGEAESGLFTKEQQNEKSTR